MIVALSGRHSASADIAKKKARTDLRRAGFRLSLVACLIKPVAATASLASCPASGRFPAFPRKESAESSRRSLHR